MKLPPIVYVATPYSDPDPAIRRQRAERVNRFCGELHRAGIPFFSPISQSHAIAAESDRTGWEFWGFQDLSLLARCSVFLVYQQHGWRTSKGLQAESELAGKLDLEFFSHPEGPLNDELREFYFGVLCVEEGKEEDWNEIVGDIWELDHSQDDQDDENSNGKDRSC